MNLNSTFLQNGAKSFPAVDEHSETHGSDPVGLEVYMTGGQTIVRCSSKREYGASSAISGKPPLRTETETFQDSRRLALVEFLPKGPTTFNSRSGMAIEGPLPPSVGKAPTGNNSSSSVPNVVEDPEDNCDTEVLHSSLLPTSPSRI